MEPIKDHTQPKVTEGEQKVILDERSTGETDELNPDFKGKLTEQGKDTNQPSSGDDPSTELI